jgi:hypothetical protein
MLAATSTAAVVIGGWGALLLLVIGLAAAGAAVGKRRYLHLLGPCAQEALAERTRGDEQPQDALARATSAA